jgi:hypothetical protein
MHYAFDQARKNALIGTSLGYNEGKLSVISPKVSLPPIFNPITEVPTVFNL